MTYSPSFFDDVNDWLSVGGDLDVAADLTGRDIDESIDDLLAHGVTHVLDLRDDWEDQWLWEEHGLPAERYRWAPIIDSWDHTPPEEWFRSIEEFVRQFWTESCHGDRLYVHCQMGVNRGPSAAMLALLTVEPEMHPWQAFLKVRGTRQCAGLVYAEPVGARHLANSNVETPEQFVERVRTYWTREQIAAARAVRPYFWPDSTLDESAAS